MTYTIQTTNLTKEFAGKPILNNINLAVETGKIYGLLGANGAGKTTLMKIMLGLLKPTSGEMAILNSSVNDEKKDYLAKIGSLIETPVFYQNLTVEENLTIHCEYLDTRYVKEIPEVLELVGLAGIEKKYIKELSLGMKQRLAIGRALLCQPELLILDEPINGIDPEGIVDIRRILVDINQKRKATIIISSHIINEIEKIADTVGIIEGGNLLEEIPKARFQEEGFNLEEHFISILHTSKKGYN
ncbi:ATP-binding cassette domain-containing protein [Listeria innocua]|uniref:ABC transporter ATP-binding protein n=1 Tax=Listeria innocua TaxID=1642 RepID=UPI0016256A21|nr:ATP-binding cassette domain-containing protein [Listeria innocua]EBF5116959.1 ATP-binding cassette domain-containing protein [Listeria monocytogenes]EBF5125875.1 ATP-binding cassette domain-containing protein [Listeria monocytogenes]EBF5152419.1 ATP-binding cassette domain-containing protein [Listeria monocytogenes]MBC1353741.1 ATP-binding cassette domain-containing protein [Listeria innocua]MBC1904747.1 ATP-binding cassette domain-containing protein [Listeria innocua]